ncbi:hypothetical protein Q3P06_25160 [Ralstonia pseudosolanacearum]|uniref:hypothetical protein n=1 Tax=Ralstonia pseudosolanacearum TaxID=1310165 RepID=UPI0026772BB1|nr:hypothetical protein [Ralstonia pseudosolanacearum]MDO3515178.1 hypothetical protein [Ralstonia pseudosolanacearum]MDO3634014.1 hypothetical protein [Ralstonia pseudosolanacearum]
MSSTTQQNAATTARVQALSQYRDTLIQALFVSKARRYLRDIETIETVKDPVLRKQFEDRRRRLAERQVELNDALARMSSDPLLYSRNARTHTGGNYGSQYSGAGGSGIVAVDDGRWEVSCTPPTNVNGLPMVGCVDVHGNPYGTTDFDRYNGF